VELEEVAMRGMVTVVIWWRRWVIRVSKATGFRRMG
jgi:hypothetical protein